MLNKLVSERIRPQFAMVIVVILLSFGLKYYFQALKPVIFGTLSLSLNSARGFNSEDDAFFVPYKDSYTFSDYAHFFSHANDQGVSQGYIYFGDTSFLSTYYTLEKALRTVEEFNARVNRGFRGIVIDFEGILGSEIFTDTLAKRLQEITLLASSYTRERNMTLSGIVSIKDVELFSEIGILDRLYYVMILLEDTLLIDLAFLNEISDRLQVYNGRFFLLVDSHIGIDNGVTKDSFRGNDPLRGMIVIAP